MHPVHTTFSFLLNLEKLIGKKIIYVSELTPKRNKWYSWIPVKLLRQICYQSLTSLDMINTILKGKNAKAIFIFEHKPQYSLFLYLVCIIKNIPIFFIVHGIQQCQERTIFHYISFKFLRICVKNFKFWPIHLEVSDKNVPGLKKFYRSIVIPHPLSEVLFCPKLNNDKNYDIKIGIVGMLRNDKPILPLIRFMAEFIKLNNNVVFIMGTPLWQTFPKEIRNYNINIIDTTEREQYFNFLQSLDIVITDFDRESFYFRPSGIINDAVSAGCFVIAPDYYIFRTQ